MAQFKSYVHKKTNKLYVVLDEIKNATNGHEDVDMILYMNTKGEKFVRELEEFNEKFILVEVTQIVVNK